METKYRLKSLCIAVIIIISLVFAPTSMADNERNINDGNDDGDDESLLDPIPDQGPHLDRLPYVPGLDDLVANPPRVSDPLVGLVSGSGSCTGHWGTPEETATMGDQSVETGVPGEVGWALSTASELGSPVTGLANGAKNVVLREVAPFVPNELDSKNAYVNALRIIASILSIFATLDDMEVDDEAKVHFPEKEWYIQCDAEIHATAQCTGANSVESRECVMQYLDKETLLAQHYNGYGLYEPNWIDVPESSCRYGLIEHDFSCWADLRETIDLGVVGEGQIDPDKVKLPLSQVKACFQGLDSMRILNRVAEERPESATFAEEALYGSPPFRVMDGSQCVDNILDSEIEWDPLEFFVAEEVADCNGVHETRYARHTWDPNSGDVSRHETIDDGLLQGGTVCGVV